MASSSVLHPPPPSSSQHLPEGSVGLVVPEVEGGGDGGAREDEVGELQGRA